MNVDVAHMGVHISKHLTSLGYHEPKVFENPNRMHTK